MSEEKKVEEINEIVENDVQEVKTNLEESLETQKYSHEQLVQKAIENREIAEKKYQEYQIANSELEKTTKDFLEQENKIIDTTVNPTIELLKELKVSNLEDTAAQIAEIKSDNKEDLLKIKTPSKGFFKGVTIGILGALATTAGALFYGSKMANLPLNTATIMQKTNLDAIANKYSELINIKDTPYVGYALVAVVALLVGFILFKITTWLQSKKNVQYISRVENDLKNYIKDLDNKIENIYDLKSHIEHIQSVMNKYDVILQEQNAKIKRMLFIEQPENGLDSLQKASKLEVEKTILLLDELLKLMNTPPNNGIEINNESRSKLDSANNVINEVIKNLYK